MRLAKIAARAGFEIRRSFRALWGTALVAAIVALLWRGWGYYRQGMTKEAIADFENALEQNPNYQDAQYALDFVLSN